MTRSSRSDPGSDSAPSGAGRTRRGLLRVAALGVAVVSASGVARGRGRLAPAADRSRGRQSGPAVALEPVARELASPVGFESPPDVDRHYVVDQAGVVHLLGPDGRRPEPFLDVRDRMVDVGGYDERGLLGLAFHPEFPEDDRVFVRYSAPPRPGTPDAYDHTFVLASFRAGPDSADPTTERSLLEIPQPQSNHNAGAVAFGPDGYLYVATGDGGGAGDQGLGHVEDWYDAVEGGNGQDVTENLLGGILRIDVDAEGDDAPYGIPDDNPLVGEEGLDEYFAWGLRNPWRMSFDPDGRLLVGDVGQDEYEEVNLVEKGGNYGWNVREGHHCYAAADCPDETPDGRPLIDPVVEYDHGGDPPNGVAVVGGHVYRGSVDALRGRYVFGDWRSGQGGGLFAATPEGEDWPVEVLSVANRPEGRMGRFLLGFGTDPDGELYVCASGDAAVGGSTGVVYRVVPPGRTTTSTGNPTTSPAVGSPTGTRTEESPGATDGTDGGGGVPLPGFGAVAALAGAGGLAAERILRRYAGDRTGGNERR